MVVAVEDPITIRVAVAGNGAAAAASSISAARRMYAQDAAVLRKLQSTRLIPHSPSSSGDSVDL
jgi:hypothetical protein